MSTTYIETPGRVFRLEITPDPDERPEHCRRKATLTVESGPDLTDEECRLLTLHLIPDLLSRGVDVTGWGAVESEEAP